MPIYEWKCIECENIHEGIVYPSQSDLFEESHCPFCGGIAKKIPSTFSFRTDGKLKTEGGPVWTDQKCDIGCINGDMQEESVKQQRDYKQAKKKGKGLDYVMGKK